MAFRDFIPEGDPDEGLYGETGYQDFVPLKKPRKHKDVEAKATPKPVRPKYVAPKGKKK